jgi:hypothetical protein
MHYRVFHARTLLLALRKKQCHSIELTQTRITGSKSVWIRIFFISPCWNKGILNTECCPFRADAVHWFFQCIFPIVHHCLLLIWDFAFNFFQIFLENGNIQTRTQSEKLEVFTEFGDETDQCVIRQRAAMKALTLRARKESLNMINVSWFCMLFYWWR